MSLTLWGANHHLDLVYGSGEPATMYIAAMLSEPVYLDTGSDLDEPVGDGYARVSVTNNSTNWSGAADGLKTNAQDIVFPMATGTWGTMRYWAICTAATGGEIISWGVMSSQLVLEGGVLRFERDHLAITVR